jgi:hypothetical protein
VEVKAEVEVFRRRAALSRQSIAGVAVAAVMTTACGLKVENSYVQSPDGTLSFRHPLAWTHVAVEPNSTEWVTGVDASDQASPDHLKTFVLDHPFVVAQVFDLNKTGRDTVTLKDLRSMALPDGRDPTTGADPGIRLIFNESYLDPVGFEGQHIRFEVDLPEGTAVEEHLATFDPDRKQLQRVRVACSLSCFDANRSDIESLFNSVRLAS